MNRILLVIGAILLALAVVFFFSGWYSLVPAFTVLGLAVMTRKALEPIILGCAIGFIMIPYYGNPQLLKEAFAFGAENGLGFPMNLLAGIEDTVARNIHNSSGLVWLVLICMLYGALIQLLLSSGGISRLVETAEKFVKTKRDSLIMTFLLGIIFFIDDYMNALTVGNTMRSVTDKFKVSREKLAMIISLICTPIAIVVPISTWTIFYGSQLLTIDSVASEFSNPVSAFANTIIFNFSAWISLIVAALVIWKVIPDLDGMKEAEKTASHSEVIGEQITENGIIKTGKLWYFFVPIVLLIFFSVLPYPTAWNAETFTIKGITSNIDALRGVATAFVCTYILFLVTGAVSFTRLSDNFIKGLESMTFVLVVLGFSYMLKEVQGVLGFDTLIAEKLGNILNPKLLPAIIFLVVSAICWSTAATWGVYAILLPLTVTLSIKTGADFWLVQGALASASVWGNASCLFSDNRVIVARATESDLISHGITQMPYQLIVLTASTILYLIAGLIL